jgi:hypothetical protein
VRLEGHARRADDEPSANQQAAYRAKYLERIETAFGSPERFAKLFSVPLITPTRLYV